MRRRVIIVAALALVILFGVIAARVAFEEWRTIATTSVTVRFEVTTEYRIGFALGTGDIAFGKVNPGGGGSRKATLAAAEPAIAVIRLPSDLAEMIRVDQNLVRLDPGTPVDVTFDLAVPEDARPGNYTGEITVTYLRRLPWE